VTTELLRFLEVPPWTSQSSKVFWKALLARLGDSDEPRVRVALEASGEHIGARIPTAVGQWLSNQCKKAAKRVPSREDGSLPAELVAVEKRLAPSLGRLRSSRADRSDAAGVERELLANVYATPKSDGPRAVYCDWLLEREDPRGAWMSAQLAGEETPPGSALRNRALDGIAAAVSWVIFRRGFADAVGLWGTKTAIPRSIGRPEWATLREVHTSWPAGEVEFCGKLLELLTHPVMGSLEVISGPDLASLDRLADAGIRFEAVGVGLIGRQDGPAALHRFLERARPRHVALGYCAFEPESLDPGAFEGVRSLQVSSALPALRWLEAIGRTGVEVLLFGPSTTRTEGEWHFSRGASGALSELEVAPFYLGHRPPLRAYPTAPLVRLLEGLGGLEGFRFVESRPPPGFSRLPRNTRVLEEHEIEAVRRALPPGCVLRS
jgi:uncharacterized protein (TIGR02996 family)